MQGKVLKRLWSVLIASAAAASLLLAGCEGDDGRDGRDAPGAGPSTINVGAISAEEQSDLIFQGEVIGVTVSSPPVVRFRITDRNGNPIVGLGQRNAAGTALNNLRFTLAKLLPAANGTPSRWVSYIVTSAPSTTAATTGNRPTGDREGTLVDNGDGTYQYSFARDISQAKALVAALTDSGNNRKADLDDLTYDPNLTHRLVIEYGGTVFNTSPGIPINNPLNLIYDFIPATGARVTTANTQREIVNVAYCNECHGTLNGTPHNGIFDPRYCVVCHTPQRAYGRPVSTATGGAYTGNTYVIEDGLVLGDFPVLVHKIHMGNRLTRTGYNYAGVRFDELGYPQSPAICRKCHRGDTADQLALTPQGNNWYGMPSRKGCGSCHDNVQFATGAGHSAGNLPQANDTACSTCHTPITIRGNHEQENVTPLNPTVQQGLANFTYEIAEATVNPTTNNLSVKFRVLRSDTPGTQGTPVTFVAPAATVTAPLAGFTGSASFILAYTLPQIGFQNVTTAVPADYNNRGRAAAQPAIISIAQLLSTTATAPNVVPGTLGPQDAQGYYTATINSASAFPVGARMRSVSMQSYFTQAAATNNIGTNTARHTVAVVKPVTGDTVRRTVVDPAKCARCHEWFEAHGGQRVYETQVCVTCHNPNLTASGRTISDAKLSAFNFTPLQQEILLAWDPAFNKATPGYALTFPEFTNNFKELIHGIHAGGTRTSPLRDVRNGPGASIALISAEHFVFPNLLENCEVCHLSAAAGTNRQTYKADLPANALPTTNVTMNATTPVTTASINAARASVPNPQDLVVSPVTGACVSCHDSPTAKAHMQANGAQLGAALNGPSYTDMGIPRGDLNLAAEQCRLCHGEGRIADVVVVHAR